MSVGKSKSKSSTTQLTPDQVAGYFNKLNQVSGGKLSGFARNGTAGQVEPFQRLDQGTLDSLNYNQLTPEQLQAVGGAGATRINSANSSRDQAVQEITSDPSLSVYQKQRAKQLTNQETQDRLDAINKETEAAIANLASQQAARTFDANKTRADVIAQDNARAFDASKAVADLTREDLDALARIFFGGKGSNSSSKSSSFDFGVGGSYKPQN